MQATSFRRTSATPRSPHAHARIRSMDVSRAASLFGVLAVLTGHDAAADGLGPMPHNPDWTGPPDVELRLPSGFEIYVMPNTPLPTEIVRFVGESESSGESAREPVRTNRAKRMRRRLISDFDKAASPEPGPGDDSGDGGGPSQLAELSPRAVERLSELLGSVDDCMRLEADKIILDRPLGAT